MKHDRGPSVFSAIRASMRDKEEFVPTPISAGMGTEAHSQNSALGIYSSVEQFALLTGFSPTAIEEMINADALTHICHTTGGIKVHVEKGLRDLERLERGPGAKASAA